MRMMQIPVYKFKELNEDAKKIALNKYRETNQLDFLSDDLKEDLYYRLEENKIKEKSDLKQYYSLGYSQGDGYCFIGRFKWKNYNIKITHNSHYYHEASTDIEIETQFYNDAKQEVYDEFKELYYSICTKQEKYGYGLIEFQDSEENIKNIMEANKYEFKETGEMI